MGGRAARRAFHMSRSGITQIGDLTHCGTCVILYEQWRGMYYKNAGKARVLISQGKHPYDHPEPNVRQNTKEREDLGV